jgi:hypothetical protein
MLCEFWPGEDRSWVDYGWFVELVDPSTIVAEAAY